jgi:hypothetical protein
MTTLQRLLTSLALPAVLLAFASLSGGLAHAETSPAKKELVQKVLALQQPGIESFARAVAVEQPVGQMLQAAGRALQAQPPDKREALGKAIDGDAKKYIDDVAPGVRKRAMELAPSTIGSLLEERLSEDELKTLLVWLESPVSRKYGQLQPELQQALGTKLMEQSRPTIEPKLKALEQTIAGRLGITAGSDSPNGNGAANAPAAKAPAKK